MDLIGKHNKIADLYDRFLVSRWKDNSPHWNNFKRDGLFNKLDVTTTYRQMNKIYDDTGTFPLRHYRGEDKLMVGCGNGPVSEAFHPLHQKAHKNYREKHSHEGWYTINPGIIWNPSLIGFFGYDEMKYLPDGSFSRICFEGLGFMVHGESLNPFLFKDLLRLTKEGGVIGTSNICDTFHFVPCMRKEDGKLVNVGLEEEVVDSRDVAYALYYEGVEEMIVNLCRKRLEMQDKREKWKRRRIENDKIELLRILL